MAIAAALDVPFSTLEMWVTPGGSLSDEVEEYKAYLADKQIQSTEDFQKRIAEDAQIAWERLKGIALSDDPTMPRHVSLAALDSMLDRIGVARVTKTEGKHTLAMTDDDRRKRFEQIRELQADLEPVQILRLAGKVKGKK